MFRTSHALIPRRQEIIAVLSDHPFLSFDGISRRFVGVPKTTLTYDVYQLVRQGLVIKHGVTRGACYTAIERSPLLETSTI